MSRIGVLLLCGLSFIWAIRGLFTVGNDSRGEYTALEKEMLRRKLKARKEEEKMVKGNVEVMQVQVNPKGVLFKRPQLDNEELVIKAKGFNNQLEILGNKLQGKIEEIRQWQAMPVTLREEMVCKTERREHVSVTDTDTDDDIELSISVASDEECETDLHYIIPNDTKSWRPEVNNEKEFSNLMDADDFSYPFEDYGMDSETSQGDVDSLNHSETSRISSGHDVSISNKVSGVSVHNIPKAKETDIWTRQTCNSTSDTSSLLGDVRNSKSTKVDAAGQLQTEKARMA